ncbi:MAG: hypothetical protein AAFY60_18965, partial [Myxococcota bacterium]
SVMGREVGGPKVSRDAIKDGGSRVVVTSKLKGADSASKKTSGAQPETAMGQKKHRSSLLDRLV